MDINIPEIPLILKKLDEIENRLKSPVEEKQWYTSKECWEIKGGCAFSTFQTKREYQCKGGIPDGYIGGRKVWSRDSVMEWVRLTDKDLPEYHKKYCTGVM